MLRSMTIQQLREWQAFSELEGLREEKEDYRTGWLVKTIRDVNRGRGKPAARLEDCILKIGDASVKKKQSWQHMKEAARMWVDAFSPKQ